MQFLSLEKQEKIHRFAPKAGIAGSCFVSLMFIIAMLAYHNERYSYSVLNHFISELGHTSDSPLFFLFSLGLCVGGPLLMILIIGLGLALNNRFGNYATKVGIVSCIACFFVGVFPADILLAPHLVAALIFFFGALITAFLFTISIYLDKGQTIPQWYLLPSLFVVICGAIFLGFPDERMVEFLNDRENFDRPFFWGKPFWEWMVFFSLILWILLTALFLRKRPVS